MGDLSLLEQPTQNEDGEKGFQHSPKAAIGRMKLIKSWYISPETMLKSCDFLKGECSRPMGKCSESRDLNLSPVDSLQRYVLPSPSISLNDTNIHNCNRLFWIRNSSDEAVRLWNLGKEIGFNGLDSDKRVIEQFEAMDYMDTERVEGDKRDDNIFDQ